MALKLKNCLGKEHKSVKWSNSGKKGEIAVIICTNNTSIMLSKNCRNKSVTLINTKYLAY